MGLKKNIVYNVILTGSQFLFPIITFPYVSRVLGPEHLGAVNFIQSFIQYFVMFALLGIMIYGQREIAVFQNDKLERSRVFWNILIIHLLATLVVGIVYVGCILCVDKLSALQGLSWIALLYLLVNPFSVEWFFLGMENFRYIVIRSVVIRTLLLISIFIFIKGPEDTAMYYFLTVLSLVLPAVLNSFYAKMFISSWRGVITRKSLWRTFLALRDASYYVLLTGVYALFPILLLGFMKDNVVVGNYAVADKLCKMVLSLFTAISAVLMPRMSSLYTNSRSEFQEMIALSLKCFIPISVFFSFILYLVSDEVVLIFSGDQYLFAANTLRLLAALVLLIPIAQIFVIQILLPMKKERQVLKLSLLSAFVGLSLNFILVPKFSLYGSAASVIISEAVMTTLAGWTVYKVVGIRIPFGMILKSVATCAFLVPLYWYLKAQIEDVYLLLIVFCGFCGLVFMGGAWFGKKRILKTEV